MNPWALLLGAIALEVVSTSLLNASQGMTRLGYGMAAMAGYGVCFWLLAFAMTRIPMGVAYAMWSGLGIVAIAVIGWVVFRQSLTLAQVGFMALILIGAIGLNLTTVRTEG
ncbi:QacE family quaternary ammonium compound efflux SMR transporter [Altererythrobacter sediminis]|uniref:QacE family quaternary ammonium compound efflux SMR transporter n=1 Tax=Allopontixanthobacter sediminis TaxID=1689985 RepID=A0A845B769_9SPHN|nr:QacE family quaternary ammonium compound efflux SMR transporter [Allopontixanthobacter sediminis]